jgi:hypothetical protein
MRNFHFSPRQGGERMGRDRLELTRGSFFSDLSQTRWILWLFSSSFQLQPSGIEHYIILQHSFPSEEKLEESGSGVNAEGGKGYGPFPLRPYALRYT